MTQAARPRYQRARRESEKAERREAILEAAGALLRETSFEGFSMGALAKKTGMAKATLYLYFETREEVLLALYVDALAAWAKMLGAGLRDGMSDVDFVTCFQAASSDDPNFMTLAARLESVIEHNVSVSCLVEAKRAMGRVLGELQPQVEHAIRLPEGVAFGLLVALGALQLGASQMEMGPEVTAMDLPDDVVAIMEGHAQLDSFRAAAPLIVAGFRSTRPTE